MTTSAPVYLYQFGAVTLPTNRGYFSWPAPARITTIPTLGGNFDGAGSDDAAPTLPYTLQYTAAVIHASDTTQIRLGLDALRAMQGQRARLWLKTADGYDRWVWARLVNVAPEMRVADRGVIQFALTFMVASSWYGSAHGGVWTFNSGYFFDNGLYFDTDGATIISSSPIAVTITNGGNRAADNCGITLHAGGANITVAKIGISGVCEFTWTGTLVAGKDLVIDCGSKTVLNDGADAWSGLALTANHKIEPWLRLAAGANNVDITLTGGSTNSTIQFTFSDVWV